MDLKVRLLMRCFRSGVFCGRGEILLVLTLGFLTFEPFNMYKNLYNTLKERKKA